MNKTDVCPNADIEWLNTPTVTLTVVTFGYMNRIAYLYNRSDSRWVHTPMMILEMRIADTLPEIVEMFFQNMNHHASL